MSIAVLLLGSLYLICYFRDKKEILSKNRCVCPLLNSEGSIYVGFILGNFIWFSGATPINLTPLRIVYFSIPVETPLSTITASTLKAALAIPAKNLLLPVSLVPIMFTTGSPSWSFSLLRISW